LAKNQAALTYFVRRGKGEMYRRSMLQVDPASLESDIFGALVLDCQIAVISEDVIEDGVRTELYKMFILMVCY
jgi:hypothetical protein